MLPRIIDDSQKSFWIRQKAAYATLPTFLNERRWSQRIRQKQLKHINRQLKFPSQKWIQFSPSPDGCLEIWKKSWSWISAAAQGGRPVSCTNGGLIVCWALKETNRCWPLLNHSLPRE